MSDNAMAAHLTNTAVISTPLVSTRFVHLKVHSEFSITDGIVQIKPLIKKIAELNMPSVALTD